MRPMRKKERQISEEEAYRILENCEYATLCTINADDGAPYGIPVSLVVQDHVIYIHMALEGQKLDNLRTDSRVCVSCVGQTLLYPEQYTTDFESAVAVGCAEILTDRAEKVQVLRVLCEKYGIPGGSSFLDKKIEGGVDRMEIIKIPIDRITGKARWRKPKPSQEP